MPAIYEVTVNYEYANQQMVNRLNYVYNGIGSYPGNLGALALISQLGFLSWDVAEAEFALRGIGQGDNFAQQFRLIRMATSTITIVTARDVNSTVDFYEWTPGLVSEAVGVGVGDGASPMIAMAFTSTKTRTDIKRGQKRFGAIPEGNLGDRGALSPAGTLVATNMERELSRILDADDENSFSPAIIKKERYSVIKDGEPTGTFAYRYWLDPEDGIANAAFPVSFNSKTTYRSQTSRQFGRGR